MSFTEHNFYPLIRFLIGRQLSKASRCESALLHFRFASTHFPKGSKSFLPTGWVLAAFFYGYLVTQIPGGWLAQRVGGKWVFGVGVVMTCVFTLLTPLAADTSVWLLVAVRVLEGLSEVSHQTRW